MTQNARNHTMETMRNGKIRLLVATDVAARGLDVSGISHIINYDLPRCAEDYVHRIGRTGRAGGSGIAISFASRSDLTHLDRIERYIGQDLTVQVIPGLEPVHALRKSNGDLQGSRRGPGVGVTGQCRHEWSRDAHSTAKEAPNPERHSESPKGAPRGRRNVTRKNPASRAAQDARNDP